MKQKQNRQPQKLEGVKTPQSQDRARRLQTRKQSPVSGAAKKTSQSASTSVKTARRSRRIADDEVLAVIRDMRSGSTYYVSVIDNFQFNGVNYAVMYNYKGEDYDKLVPEILIMRSYRDQDKQFFTSVHDKKEMDTIFDVFYDRFQQSM